MRFPDILFDNKKFDIKNLTDEFLKCIKGFMGKMTVGDIFNLVRILEEIVLITIYFSGFSSPYHSKIYFITFIIDILSSLKECFKDSNNINDVFLTKLKADPSDLKKRLKYMDEVGAKSENPSIIEKDEKENKKAELDTAVLLAYFHSLYRFFDKFLFTFPVKLVDLYIVRSGYSYLLKLNQKKSYTSIPIVMLVTLPHIRNTLRNYNVVSNDDNTVKALNLLTHSNLRISNTDTYEDDDEMHLVLQNNTVEIFFKGEKFEAWDIHKLESIVDNNEFINYQEFSLSKHNSQKEKEIFSEFFNIPNMSDEIRLWLLSYHYRDIPIEQLSMSPSAAELVKALRIFPVES
jgi:hypothetical protein